jgi:GNAT superfamily N-acetyltransferase
MADVKPPRPLREDDDRNQFDCGRESLNGWFRRHGWANHLSGASRVNVLCDAHDDKIIGYVTLSAGQIERSFLPKARQRNQPDPLPVTLLGQLAVDKAFQGQGHATSLLIFALNTAIHAAEIVGSIGVITHPLDDDMRVLYAKWGFEDLPFGPHRAMIIRMVDLRRNGFEI